jgi:GAF domain-containing protein
MKRRSKAGGERIKGRRPKTPEPVRGNAPKGQPRSKLSPAIEETEVARLTRELTDERKQRRATSEVLRLLSGSQGDLNHLFDTILANATNLCQANFGTLSLCEGDAFRIVAMHNVPPGLAELRRREPLVRAGPLLRIAETKRLLHIADYTEYVASHPADSDAAAFAKLTGVRTILEVPMLKDDDVVGAVVIYRTEVRRFDDREMALIKDFAAQAVIAIENARLLNELRQRTIDLSEALEQQTAASDVLQVISGSPGHPQPVFATMLEKAVHVCDASFGTLYLLEDGRLRLMAAQQVPEFITVRAGVPREPTPGGVFDEVIRTKRTVQIADLAAIKPYIERQPTVVEAVELGGIRTTVGVPMLKDDKLIGIITIVRQEVRPFTDKQIALVTSFAAQAVIAIENARLLNELREALEQQTATAEVLTVISSSPNQLDPVFRTMLTNAARLCEADFGQMLLYQGAGHFLNVAMHNAPPAFAELRKREPMVRASGTLARVATDKRSPFLHIADCTEDASYKRGDADFVKFVDLCEVKTLLGVPMLRDEELIGVIGIYRKEVRPFAEKQIALLRSFAAQAVIAIENARLLAELRETLQEQTATAEVLQIISSSPGDLEPVFAAMLEKAVRICDATFGNVQTWDGETFRVVATYKTPPALIEAVQDLEYRPSSPQLPFRQNGHSGSRSCIRTGLRRATHSGSGRRRRTWRCADCSACTYAEGE